MSQHGTVIFAGMYCYMFAEFVAEIHVKLILFFPMLGSVKISLLCCVETKLMSRTGRSRQNRLLSTGRRTCSTMKFQQRVITTLRSLSCTLPGSLLGMLRVVIVFISRNFLVPCLCLNCGFLVAVMLTCTLLSLRHWLHLKFKLI